MTATKPLEELSEGTPTCAEWIPITKQRPPLIAETPETKGFFLLLRHNPNRDAAGQYRMHLWFGSVPIDSTHWARIPALPKTTA